MKSKALTNWFPCKIQPVRSGWYLVKGEGFIDGKIVMRYFDVEKQKWYWVSYKFGFRGAAVSEKTNWCGMKKEK